MRRSGKLAAVLVVVLGLTAISGCSAAGGKQSSAAGNMVREATRTVSATTTATKAPPKRSIMRNGKGDVVAVLDSSPDLTIFVRLLRASGLARALHKQRHITVIAPNNDAFDELGPTAVTRLLEPGNTEKLRTLLRHHFVAYAVPVDQMVNVRRLSTYEGTPIMVKQSDTTVVMDGKVVVLAHDIPAKNGMVHVVNGVLLPKGFKP